MRHRILKSFKGSPDGRFAIDYHAGEEVELTASLARVAVEEGWAEEIRERKAVNCAPENKAINNAPENKQRTGRTRTK